MSGKEITILVSIAAVLIAAIVIGTFFGNAANCAKCGTHVNGFEIVIVSNDTFRVKMCNECVGKMIERELAK